MVLLKSVFLVMMWGFMFVAACFTLGFPTHVVPNFSINSSALSFDCHLSLFVWFSIVKLKFHF
jgi:hypothetical protein